MTLLIDHEVIRLLKTMNLTQRRTLLREVIDNMAERNDPEEMATFLSRQLGSDDLEVTRAHAARVTATRVPKAKRTQQYRDLLPDELEALQIFAAEFGKKWKETLSFTYWYNARIYRARRDGKEYTVLHRMRNEFGPEWLAQFTLPQA
jgi:hypothetical protein